MADVKSYSDAIEMQRRVRCFMDGIDWQHHLDGDMLGTPLFPSVEDVREQKNCLKEGGGCGIVEVEVRLVRWVEKQDLTADGVILTEDGWSPATTSPPPQMKTQEHPSQDE